MDIKDILWDMFERGIISLYEYISTVESADLDEPLPELNRIK